MKAGRAIIWIAAAMAGMSGGTPSAAPASGDSAKGKTVYEQRCLACHGSLGKGDGPMGKVLVPPATNFTGAESRKKSDADLLKIIENGKPATAMAAWKGQLSEQDIRNVLAYVITLRK